jgi:prepilin-type N-terminal cleavage/methylation domain-containing protein
MKETQERAYMQEAGFTLVEMMIALAILSIVGMMAFRGLGALVKGREVIEKQMQINGDYRRLVGQFERDCHEMVQPLELGSVPWAIGSKSAWFVRHSYASKTNSWVIVGYSVSESGLQRWISRDLQTVLDVQTLWFPVVRDPDFMSSDMQISMVWPNITKQGAQTQTLAPNAAAFLASAAPSIAGNNAASLAKGVPYLSPQGVGIGTQSQIEGIIMRWWSGSSPLPIERSCLAGYGV